jgi:hypothetical protein
MAMGFPELGNTTRGVRQLKTKKYTDKKKEK